MKSGFYFVLLVWYMMVQGSSQQRLDYQEKCEKTPIGIPDLTPCDYIKYLECTSISNSSTNQSFCLCRTLPGADGNYSLYYDNDLSTCVSPWSGPCWTRFHEGNYELPCSKNAVCVQADTTNEGYCECIDGFSHQTQTGNCVVPYDGSCSASTDCDFYAHLVCSEQKCSCGPKSEWVQNYVTPTNQTVSACVGLVGGSCDANPQRRKECTANAQCENNLCKCEPNFQEYDFHCYKTFNETCTPPTPDTSARDCHPYFECLPLEGGGDLHVCQCPANYDVSDESDGERRCLGRSGEQCDPLSDISYFCSPFSTCTNGTVGQNSTCVCEAGYSPNSDKLCRANHGTTCVSDTNNSTNSSLCNQERKLTCNIPADATVGVCECKESHQYDGQEMCLGFIDQACTSDTECLTNHCNANNTCGCSVDATPSGDKKQCLHSFGTSCDPQDNIAVCDRNKLLACSGGICNCTNEEEHIREGTNDGCSIRAGKGCSDSEPAQMRCVSSSMCSVLDGAGVCLCASQYAQSADGLCFPSSSADKVSFSFLGIALVSIAAFLN